MRLASRCSRVPRRVTIEPGDRLKTKRGFYFKLTRREAKDILLALNHFGGSVPRKIAHRLETELREHEELSSSR